MPKFYRLADIYLNTELPLLIDSEGEESELEPRTWHLLIYFCRHAGQIVSRDDIIEHINGGTIVSENAINKMVAKVRKQLNDTPANPKFIKTHPKQGYSLIAEMAELEQITRQSESGKKEDSGVKASAWRSWLIVAASSVTLLVGGFWSLQSTPVRLVNSKLTHLTHHQGVESSPNMSPDGAFLLYRKHSPQQSLHQWWLKSLNGEADERQLVFASPHTTVAWQRDSKRFLFVEYSGQNCKVKQTSIHEEITKSMQEAKTLLDCGNKVLAQIILDSGELGFYYVATVGQNPWQVFYYQFSTSKSHPITQPERMGIGNYAIDLSPDGDKLLILSSNQGDGSLIYQLDLNTDMLQHIGSRSWLMAKAIWHHDNETLVHVSSQYGRELVHTDHNGQILSNLVSTSKRVSDNFQRHPNGKDFYFSSFQMNNDITVSPTDKAKNEAAINSELYEKLPLFGRTDNEVYFVSNRFGMSQIFVAELDSGLVKQVSRFKREWEFLSVDIAPDKQTIAFHQRGELILLDLTSGLLERISVPEGRVLALNWLSDTTVSASIAVGEQISVSILDVKTKLFGTPLPQWQAIFADPKGNAWYGLAQNQRQIFVIDRQFKILKDLDVRLERPFAHIGLMAKAAKNALYFANQEGDKTLITRFDLLSQEQSLLGKWLYVAGFDVLDEHIVLSHEVGRSGDVVRTHLVEVD